MIPEKIIVEVWSDVTCVHCFLAKKNFETALAKFKYRDQVDVIWRSFELAPELEVERGKSMYQFLADYNGATLEQVKSVCEQIVNAGNKVGLTYNFNTAVPANSFRAHQFVHLAKDYHLQNEAKEALFRAHFTDGLDIDDVDVLKQIATTIGMDPDAVHDLAVSNKYAEPVKMDEETARKKGIHGVPYYLFNSTHAITGAKESILFLEALEKSYTNIKSYGESNLPSGASGDVCEIGERC